jgi:tetratricopeptide (TPR) repeat protein
MIKKGFILGLFFVALSVNAQLTKGFQHIYELKWKSAQAAFAAATEEEALFYNGLCMIKIDQEDQAKTLFESAKDKPFGMIGLGMLALNAKNDAKAEEYFQNAAKITKNKDPKVLSAIGQAYANSQAINKEKGMEWSKKGVDLSPRNFDFRILYLIKFRLSLEHKGKETIPEIITLPITLIVVCRLFNLASNLWYSSISQIV